MIRFAVLTDIHYGLDKKKRLGSFAPGLMDGFIEEANRNVPELIIDIGDRVSSFTPELDEQHMIALREKFNRVAAPVYSCLGNNDIRNLSAEDNARIMGRPMHSYSVVHGGYRFVLWNPDVNTDKAGGLSASAAERAWLKAELAKSKEPVILFSHIPLDNNERDNRKAFKEDFGREFRSYYPEVEDIRRIIEEAGNVILCMAGHKHRNRHRVIGGVHYILQQSMSEQVKDRPGAVYGAWSMVEIKDGEIRVQGHGFRQPSYRFRPGNLPAPPAQPGPPTPDA